jgi:hypothetical protein
MKSSYSSPNALLSASSAQYQSDAAGRGGARDFSQPVYTPWRTTLYTAMDVPMVAPAEFLQAVRFVKGSPLTVLPGVAGSPTLLSVVVQRDSLWTGDADDMFYTDLVSSIFAGPSESGATIPMNVARLGLRVTGLKIDSAVAPSASRDPSAWRVAAASNRLLMAVDATVGGDGTLFPSLSSLASSVGHLETAAGAVTLDDRAIDLLGRVSATGRGCGEGVHALVGKPKLLSALAKTATAKTNGSCGWRVDPRTGLMIYHFLGVPFYRCELADDAEGNAQLFAVNLGPTGLTMVHAYGSAETYGLEVEQEPTHPQIAARDILVHGAWTLAMWDPGALFGVKGITY